MNSKSSYALILLLAAPWVSASAAGVERSFPLLPTGETGPLGSFELIPVVEEILELRAEGANLTFVGVPLPSGVVDIDLRRLYVDIDARVYVNGQPQSGPADHGDLSIWRGKIRGRAGSDVLFGLSAHGCHGWVHDGTTRWNLLSSSGPDQDWSAFTSRFVSEASIVSIGPETGPVCATDTSGGSPILVDDIGPTHKSMSSRVATLECPIAIETDYQLYQTFGSLAAMQNYVTLLITAVSDRMLEQADVVLTYPYIGYYTTANDPWQSQDNGGDCGAVLNEFQQAWNGNIPNGAALGHFISGAHLGCGVAWVGVVCNPVWGFSLSCCINGGVSFPVQQGSNTWDFFVMAHELGHNFGSYHTHDYCPPLDECAGSCTGNTQCTNQGTNLSYCHGCPGGMNNITTYYHPTVVAVMRQHAENSCLGSYCMDVSNYCVGFANSAYSGGAEMDWAGSTSVTQNDFHVMVFSAVPGNLGLFFYGAGQVFLPFGDGMRCVGGGGAAIQRLGPPRQTQPLGHLARQVDFTTGPASSGPGQILPASTWNFQFWYRDPAGGPAGFNLSDALRVTFCP